MTTSSIQKIKVSLSGKQLNFRTIQQQVGLLKNTCNSAESVKNFDLERLVCNPFAVIYEINPADRVFTKIGTTVSSHRVFVVLF
jgi:hypothetical protein